jgi:hypothetical protein
MGQKQPLSPSITQRVHTPTSDDRVATHYEESKKQKEPGQRQAGQPQTPGNAGKQSSRESVRPQRQQQQSDR